MLVRSQFPGSAYLCITCITSLHHVITNMWGAKYKPSLHDDISSTPALSSPTSSFWSIFVNVLSNTRIVLQSKHYSKFSLSQDAFVTFCVSEWQWNLHLIPCTIFMLFKGGLKCPAGVFYWRSLHFINVKSVFKCETTDLCSSWHFVI